MAQVLRHLAAHQGSRTSPRRDPRALVGFGTSDDAAVYRLSPTLAVVETVDFFPPIVDDPYQFGQIAAANSLSDIWAMGAKPIFALNLVGFPRELPVSMLSEILAGGQSKAQEAGVPILGGHSVRDPEPKYGMAVTGIVHPRRVLTNAGAKAGDVLILTKPLGSGIATTAIKQGTASPKLIESVVKVMAELNQKAGEVFASRRFKVNALTDVTGFGLLGHLLGMMRAAKRRAKLFAGQVPILDGVVELAAKEIIPGGTKSNLKFVEESTQFAAEVPQNIRWVLADAQTNGGLLASVPAREAPKALQLLAKSRIHAAQIGEVAAGPAGIDVSA